MKIELPKEAATPADLRAEIFRLRRELPVVRAVMDTADFNGLSAEDRYTMLAYYALRDYARVHNMLMDHVLSMPTQRFVASLPAAAKDDEPAEDLYDRLHSLSKSLESSGRLDEHDNPGAYATVLDAMNYLRRAAPTE